ncbi:hypothetical protein BGZ65_012139, partial [Modicella reniformis]
MANSQKAGKHSIKGCGQSYPDEAHDEIIDDELRVPVDPLKSEARGTDNQLQYNEYIVYD